MASSAVPKSNSGQSGEKNKTKKKNIFPILMCTGT